MSRTQILDLAARVEAAKGADRALDAEVMRAAGDIDDEDYPAEWIIDADGPRCTAFSESEPDADDAIHDARQGALFA